MLLEWSNIMTSSTFYNPTVSRGAVSEVSTLTIHILLIKDLRVIITILKSVK